MQLRLHQLPARKLPAAAIQKKPVAVAIAKKRPAPKARRHQPAARKMVVLPVARMHLQAKLLSNKLLSDWNESPAQTSGASCFTQVATKKMGHDFSFCNFMGHTYKRD